MKTFRNLKSGLTLIEILMSVALLGICIAGLLTALTTGISSTYNAKHHIQAINIARQKIEELKSRGYSYILSDDMNVGPFTVTIDDGGTPNEDFNFDGKLDAELDENNEPIPGTGEDLNGNGALDTNSEDDILGQLTITIGSKIDLNNATDEEDDDALPVTVIVTWEKTIGGQEIEETIQVLIPKEGVT